jgi:hypothetical protein
MPDDGRLALTDQGDAGITIVLINVAREAGPQPLHFKP